MSNNNKGIDFIDHGGMILLPSQRISHGMFSIKDKPSLNDNYT
jgi:hypothetical protein